MEDVLTVMGFFLGGTLRYDFFINTFQFSEEDSWRFTLVGVISNNTCEAQDRARRSRRVLRMLEDGHVAISAFHSLCPSAHYVFHTE